MSRELGGESRDLWEAADQATSEEGSTATPRLPAVLVRPKVANHIVHESFTVDTQDYKDHTFCGIMFDVSCRREDEGVPLEYILVDAVAVRGELGPLTVWTTPGSYAGKEHSSACWELVYEREHPPSPGEYVRLELASPVRLAPGESCGLYVHSSLPGDEAIVYDNLRFDRHRNRLPCEDQVLRVLPGQAHLSNQAFGRQGMWWGVWRANREFVGRISYGVSYRLWNPVRETHAQFPESFRKAVLTCLLCARRPECPLYYMQDAVVFYILNMCRYDWFDSLKPQAPVAPPRAADPRGGFAPAPRFPHPPRVLAWQEDGDECSSEESSG